MSKKLIFAMLALVSLLAIYSGFVMNEKFSFASVTTPETKTTGLEQ